LDLAIPGVLQQGYLPHQSDHLEPHHLVDLSIQLQVWDLAAVEAHPSHLQITYQVHHLHLLLDLVDREDLQLPPHQHLVHYYVY